MEPSDEREWNSSIQETDYFKKNIDEYFYNLHSEASINLFDWVFFKRTYW